MNNLIEAAGGRGRQRKKPTTVDKPRKVKPPSAPVPKKRSTKK